MRSPVTNVLFAGCAAPQVVTKNPEALAKIKHIAVIPFSDGLGVMSRKSGQATAGFLMAEISQSARYDLVERTQIKALMDEQDLQISSIADPSTAKKFRRLRVSMQLWSDRYTRHRIIALLCTSPRDRWPRAQTSLSQITPLCTEFIPIPQA